MVKEDATGCDVQYHVSLCTVPCFALKCEGCFGDVMDTPCRETGAVPQIFLELVLPSVYSSGRFTSSISSAMEMPKAPQSELVQGIRKYIEEAL